MMSQRFLDDLKDWARRIADDMYEQIDKDARARREREMADALELAAFREKYGKP